MLPKMERRLGGQPECGPGYPQPYERDGQHYHYTITVERTVISRDHGFQGQTMLTASSNNRLVFLAEKFAAAFAASGHDNAVFGTD
jgi:hypothetical protein